MNQISDVREAVKSVGDVTLKLSKIPQAIFTIEECSELIKELTKRERGKGSADSLVDEACDVLTSVFILLSQIGVSENEVKDKILFKCNRALNRMNQAGEF